MRTCSYVTKPVYIQHIVTKPVYFLTHKDFTSKKGLTDGYDLEIIVMMMIASQLNSYFTMNEIATLNLWLAFIVFPPSVSPLHWHAVCVSEATAHAVSKRGDGLDQTVILLLVGGPHHTTQALASGAAGQFSHPVYILSHSKASLKAHPCVIEVLKPRLDPTGWRRLIRSKGGFYIAA